MHSCARKFRVAYDHPRVPTRSAFPIPMPTVSSPSPDPVLETQVFWAKYQKPIVIGILAVLVGAIAAGGYWLYQMRRNEGAAAQLAQAKTAPAFQQVIEQYSGTPAAASAQLLLAAEQ